jgi:microcystin degradation protein MlrC
MLAAALRKEIKPVMSAVKLPMITAAERQLTQEHPMGELMAATRRQEEDGRVLSSSVFAVQPLLDIPEMGWCTVVVTDGHHGLASRMAGDLADMAWNQRKLYHQPCPTYVEAIDDAFSMDVQPVVIADFADMMTGGGTGDSTWFLKELLSRRPEQSCYLTMVDPQAVSRMVEAGRGAEVTLSLGGKQDNLHSTPVVVTGNVLRVLKAPSSSEIQQHAMSEPTGTSAVLQIGNISVVVLDRMGEGADPSIYYTAGLEPKRAKIIVAKSIVDFRYGYKGVAKRFLLGEAPGLCPSNLLTLEWEKVPRPIFPLDGSVPWDRDNATVYTNCIR